MKKNKNEKNIFVTRPSLPPINEYIKEIEETAMERPALALLTTFALGIIVGHLFTRK